MSTQQLTTVSYLQVNALNGLNTNINGVNTNLNGVNNSLGLNTTSLYGLTIGINTLIGTISSTALKIVEAMAEINHMPVSFINKFSNAFGGLVGFMRAELAQGLGVALDKNRPGGVDARLDINEAYQKMMATPTNTSPNIPDKPIPTNAFEGYRKQMDEMFKDKGFMGGLKAVFNKLGATAKGSLGGIGAMLGGAMGAVAPQMMMMAVALAPITALIEGILSPLEPLTEVFGAIGETLGMALVPAVNFMIASIVPLLPLISQVSTFLGPIIGFLFQFGTPLGWLLNFLPIISELLTTVGYTLSNFFGLFTANSDAFTNITTAWSNFGNTVSNFFANIGSSISNMWENLGTQITGGGFDGKGWW